MNLATRVVRFITTVLTTNVQFAAGPRLLGRITGAGAGQEIELGTGLEFFEGKLRATAAVTTSGGGNGAGDSGKAATYGASGTLTASAQVAIINAPITFTMFGSGSGSGFVNADGAASDYLLFPTSPNSRTWTLPTLAGALARVVSATGQIFASDVKGTTTTDDAESGFVGEYLEAEGEIAIALTDGIVAAIGNLQLPAGDWEVEGFALVSSQPGPANTFDRFAMELSNDSAGAMSLSSYNVYIPTGPDLASLMAFTFRAQRSGTAYVYLNVLGIFTGASATAEYYKIRARRVR